MNHVYHFAILFLLPFLLEAQPTITPNIAPQIGETWDVTFLEPDSFNPGPAGANQQWNFSDLDISNSLELVFQTLEPEEVIGHEDFPTADFVWHIPSFEIYEFYEVEADSISLVGGASISNGEINFLTIFTDAEDGLHLPLNYQDSYTYYSAFDQYIFGNFLISNDRNGIVTADAYGSITTPSGTYDNVLRVVIQETSFGFTNTQYAWFDVNNFVPVFVYEISDDPETLPSLYYAVPNLVNNTNQLITFDTPWKAWYNHAEKKIVIDLPKITTSQQATLQLTDMQGKALINRRNITDNDTQIVIDLPKDISTQLLFVSIQDGAKISTKKVLISY